MSNDDVRDGKLDDAARDALARWQPPGPPDVFADRVVAAQAATPAPPRRMRPRPRWGLYAGVAAAGLAAIWLWPHPSPPPIDIAARRIDAREAIAIGGRGVAVAEPGTVLGWRRSGGAAYVTQDAGDVFYRVDPGGPFTVTTPAGEVHVTGTCFRVEVSTMKPSKQAILSAAAGAAIATVATVTVYEGKVLVASPSGKTEIKAGEHATLAPGTPPTIDPATAPTPPGGGSGVVIARVTPDDPPATITRDQLLVRDKAQRDQIAALAKRVKDLEVGGPGGKGKPGGDLIEDWMHTSKEDLVGFAKECKVQIDAPPAREPMQVPPEWAHDLGLSSDEVATANQVFSDEAADWTHRVRGWYLEATGDAQGADTLSVDAMTREISDKAARGEQSALQKRIAQERAGLIAPLPPGARMSPFERYFRGFASLGDDLEQALAAKLGPDKARAVRAHDGGWPMRMQMSGCGDEDDNGQTPPM